ncbi:unnamed protein product [Brachionus calyciflorus]|uniref:Uncharacterized protein n=1 Tax=Brachionus calyciflorus TaxID=104777 RepID=A0A813QEC3_9BILA|nr:unnamed protein product [Brachionus calyciflorus]
MIDCFHLIGICSSSIDLLNRFKSLGRKVDGKLFMVLFVIWSIQGAAFKFIFLISSLNSIKVIFSVMSDVGFVCIRRHVDTLGLKVAYSSNDEIQFFIKSFMALSKVPVHLVDDAFLIILEIKNQLQQKLTNDAKQEEEVIATTRSTSRGRGHDRARGSIGVRRGRIN